MSIVLHGSLSLALSVELFACLLGFFVKDCANLSPLPYESFNYSVPKPLVPILLIALCFLYEGGMQSPSLPQVLDPYFIKNGREDFSSAKF